MRLIILSLILALGSHTGFTNENEVFFEIVDEDNDLYCSRGKKKEFEWNLAVVSVFQNEAKWLKEWIEFHKIVGVDHFYLYNNRSSDDFYTVLSPYLESGEVELYDWPFNYEEGKEGFWIKVQTDAINDAIERSKERAKWLAIIDTDEFLVPIKYNSILDLLNSYEKIIPRLSQVSIKWVMFGTSNVAEIPSNRLMIEVLTKNSGRTKDALYKSIVKPKDVIECGNTHYAALVKKRKTEHVPFEHAQINHYWTRDELYLMQTKLPRREKIGYSADTVLKWAEDFNHDNDETARPISRFIETIRQKLGM